MYNEDSPPELQSQMFLGQFLFVHTGHNSSLRYTYVFGMEVVRIYNQLYIRNDNVECKKVCDMVNRCIVNGCKNGSEKRSIGKGQFSTFRFPLKKSELLIEWERFVNRGKWKATESSVICDHHFEETFISRGKRNTFFDVIKNPTDILKMTSCDLM